jgi:Tol biopolymer transport system component
VDAPGSGPAPTQFMPFGEQATALSVSRRNGRLVYARQFRDSSIWRISLPSWRTAVPYAAVTPVRLIASTFLNHTPDYSPDGTKIAFASTRSGVEEIWMAHADGSAPVQLTYLGGAKAANPQWSPDGHDILFNSSKEGSSDLYLITPETGSVRRLTQDPADEIEARWSRDGRWIYFGSNRTGRYEVYKMSANGGPAVQVTKDGGRVAVESQDGAWLYYSKGSIGSVWRIPRSGGKEEPVLNNLSYSSNFVVVERGIYFVAGKDNDAQSGISVDFLDFASGKAKSLLRIQKAWSYGMAISPDHQSLLFSVVDTAGSNLMFVGNFR